MDNPYHLAKAELPHHRLNAGIDLRAWLLGEARHFHDFGRVLEGFCERALAAGVPLDRAAATVRTLHAELAGAARIWEPGKAVEARSFDYTPHSEAAYKNSPIAHAHAKREWVELRLEETPDDAFGIVPDLKAAGFTHYFCVPVVFMPGTENSITFATRKPEGFSRHDVIFLRFVVPALAVIQEIYALNRMMGEVLKTYVGSEPQTRILAGQVHRGEVTRIASAILFCDMRGFTAITADLTPEASVALLNRYYDCVLPPIAKAGGEILKLIGDGVLAIFRVEEEDEIVACSHAIEAARAILASASRYGSGNGEEPDFELGIGLHFGQAAYGNVGAGDRLDFTIIGRDVNKASRIAALCGPLERHVLVSEEFAQRLGQSDFRLVRRMALRGLPGLHGLLELIEDVPPA
ncbi:MAG: adenylate/guanylate cyclase domain-containing protein [Hyphomicrobiaceae bacterium]|nr:MAG: adenylate/guanylate cyclase domain-containing protein [Hyphomicrobiaceae bacterium]